MMDFGRGTKEKTTEIIDFSGFCWYLFLDGRRVRDSNPRYPLGVYTLSRRAPSTTRTTLLFRAAKITVIPSAPENFFSIIGRNISYLFSLYIFYFSQFGNNKLKVA